MDTPRSPSPPSEPPTRRHPQQADEGRWQRHHHDQPRDDDRPLGHHPRDDDRFHHGRRGDDHPRRGGFDRPEREVFDRRPPNPWSSAEDNGAERPSVRGGQVSLKIIYSVYVLIALKQGTNNAYF
jgi:hypothetical protein